MTEQGAQGSLEAWCKAFGPCPQNLQQAIGPGPERMSRILVHGNHRVYSRGFLGGRSFTFERDRLVGAQIWNDMAYGACKERGVVTYTGGFQVPRAEPDASCGVVPGRDYTSGEPCRCNLKAEGPFLAKGNQGPTLRTSLECLYEVGITAHLCHATLKEQRDLMAHKEEEAKAHGEIAAGMRRARGSAPMSAAERIEVEQAAFRSSERALCGGTVISGPYEKAIGACRYDAQGALVGMRWGKRYESDGFTTCQK